MIAAAVIAMVVAGTVPGAPLDVTSVDASAYPTVVIDFVVPEPYAAVDLTPSMVDVDGAPVDAIAPVDAASVVVRLAVDDRPAVPPDVVGVSQGAAVEFVRNTAIGTRIAVDTPSGLQTAATTDPGATIARIAAITAGAPAVTPLPDLIRDSAAALAADESTDRHLVVALGGPLDASDAQLAEIAEVTVANGITLHLLRAAGAPEAALTLIAEQSGGTTADASETLAFFDTVTAAISNRYRITTTLTAPGDHVVRLTVDGPPLTAHVDVQQPAMASGAPVPATGSSPTAGAPAAVVGAVSTTVAVGSDVDTAVADDDTTLSDQDAAAADDEGDSPLAAIAIALEIAMVGVVVVWLTPRWRRRWRDRAGHSDPSAQPTLDLEGTSAAEPRPALVSQAITAPQPLPARRLPTRTIAQPQPARWLVALPGSRPDHAVSDATRSEAIPVPADGGTGSEPVRPKPKPKPRPKRTPKPAGEQAGTAESGPAAASAPTPKPKAKRTPKPKPPLGASSAAASASDVPKAVTKPKAKRTPKPKPQPELRLLEENQLMPVEAEPVQEPMPDGEPVPEATATREPIVDQTPAHQPEPEPISEPTRDREPEHQDAADAATEPVVASGNRSERVVPSSRSARRRAEHPSTSPRTRRGAQRGSAPAAADAKSSVDGEWLVAGNLRFRAASGEVWAGRNQVHLTPSELAILELLMTGGDRGVAEADIIVAGGLEPDGRDLAETLGRIRRKTGLAGSGQAVRRERVMLYFLDNDVGSGPDARASHMRSRASVRR